MMEYLFKRSFFRAISIILICIGIYSGYKLIHSFATSPTFITMLPEKTQAQYLNYLGVKECRLLVDNTSNPYEPTILTFFIYDSKVNDENETYYKFKFKPYYGFSYGTVNYPTADCLTVLQYAKDI